MLSNEELANIFIQTMQAHADARPYDWVMFYVGIFGIIASLLVAYFAYRLNKKQIAIAERQSKISEEQTEIAKKQSEIMEQQNEIALLEYRITVFASINQVLRLITENKFKENFILSFMDKNFYIRKLTEWTTIRDNFIEQAYNSSVYYDTEISTILIDASTKFDKYIETAIESIFRMEVHVSQLSEKEQLEALSKRKEFIKNQVIEIEKLPDDLKALFYVDDMYKMSEELYNILSNKEFQNKIDYYIEKVKHE